MNGAAHHEARGASERAGVYRLLASGFLEPPTPERIALLCDGTPSAVSGSQGSPPPESSAGVSPEQDARQEFMDLFKIPTGKYVPPYEAVHRDSRIVEGEPTRGLLMGPSTVDVRRLYQDAGASLELPELPDHIGVELGFMAFLCEREEEARLEGDVEALENYRRYQKGFLEGHVLAWVPNYCEIVGQRSTTPYVQALTALTREFCQSDFARIQ